MFNYNENGSVSFYCPACKGEHMIDKRWKISNEKGNETVKPSVLVRCHDGDPEHRCHLFITNGKIKYLTDCSHDFKGQTVDIYA